MQRQRVDELLDERHRHEVASDVEVRTAPREPRLILDNHRRNAKRMGTIPTFRGHQLPQALQSVEHPGSRLPLNLDRVGIDNQAIPLFSKLQELINLQNDRILCRDSVGQMEVRLCHIGDLLQTFIRDQHRTIVK